jgi:hypothetical protein
MLRVGYEPTTPAFGRAKTVHAFDRAATVIGCNVNTHHRFRNISHDLKKMFRNVPPQWVQSHERGGGVSLLLSKCEHRAEESTTEFRGGNSINYLLSWPTN